MTCLRPQAGTLKSRTCFKSIFSKIESKIIIGFDEEISTKEIVFLAGHLEVRSGSNVCSTKQRRAFAYNKSSRFVSEWRSAP
jgi:hypothetical protein